MVMIQKFDSTMQGWVFGAQALTSGGEVTWNYFNATEDGLPVRPNEGGIVWFNNVPVTSSGHFQIMAIPPGGAGIKFRPQAPFAPLVSGPVLFNLAPVEAEGQIQSNSNFSNANTGSTSSQASTEGGEISAELGGTGGKSNWSGTRTETGPSRTDTVGSGTTVVTPTRQVMSLSLTRTMHIGSVASLAPSKLAAFG